MEKMIQHPLMEAVGNALQEGPDGTLVVQAGPLSEVQQCAMEIETGAEMFRLVLQLTSFAAFLGRDKESPDAAQAIFAMADPLAARLIEMAKNEGRADDRRFVDTRRRLATEKSAVNQGASALAGLAPAGGPGASIRDGGSSKWRG